MTTLTRAADRALAISEVLELTFSLCRRRDAVQCARVCTSWKDLALDRVWRDLESLLPLFEILAPLDLLGESSSGSSDDSSESETDDSQSEVGRLTYVRRGPSLIVLTASLIIPLCPYRSS